MTLARPGLKGFEKLAATIKPDPRKRLAISDPDTRGLYLRVTPKGGKSWTIVARNPDGKQVWTVIGDYEHHSLEEARRLAREGVKRVKAGEPAFPKVERPKVLTFRAVHDNFIKRYVDKKALRSGAETKRIFDNYVLPEWGEIPFKNIDRDDVATLLDDIEDGRLKAVGKTRFRGGGPVMADRVLAALSKLFAWHATRDSKYNSPIVPGMARSNSRERARTRMLSDDELRLFWLVAGGSGAFGAFLQTCLLTAQRRAKVMTMRWEDVGEDGVWTIPAEAREKASAGVLQLPPVTRAIVHSQPRVVVGHDDDGNPIENPYVFSARGDRHMVPGDKLKKDFDGKLAKANGGEAIPAWTIHDLRRTAKSLMARAGVRPDVSERVLGHVIGGVEGVYDRHDYNAEKADALVKLAGLVEKIINPPTGNVLQFAESAAR